MTKRTRSINAPNGIVFLYDPKMIVDVPEDTGAGPILSTRNCISIWTIHGDEGQVELTISDEDIGQEKEIRFVGEITTENCRISINDATVREVVGLDIDSSVVKVRVYTDDPIYPTRVLCVVS